MSHPIHAQSADEYLKVSFHFQNPAIIPILKTIIFFTQSATGSSSLTNFVSSSPIWTNAILLVSLLAFLALRTFTRIRKHKKVLPLLNTLSSGPFSSTRRDPEGIIHPLLNYRKKIKKVAFSQRRNQGEIEKNQGETEILNAMKLIELQEVKFIDENQTNKEGRKEGKPTHQPTLMSDPGNVGQQ